MTVNLSYNLIWQFVFNVPLSAHCYIYIDIFVTWIDLCFSQGIYFCYAKYKDLDDRGIDKSIEWQFTSNLDGFTNSKKFWLAAGESFGAFMVHLCIHQRNMCSKFINKTTAMLQATLFNSPADTQGGAFG